MYTYCAYGLNIHSSLPLPELITGNGEADVVVRVEKIGNLPAGAKDASRYIQVTNEGIYLAWRDIGAMLVRNGQEIIVDPKPGVEEQVLRLFILGTALAMLLHQRGETVVLHASAVAISGQAVAFVGVKHAGKSTMAAALQAQGHDLVADDILPVDMRQESPMALPGFPHIKLWPDSITSLGYAPEELPLLRPELEKRGHRVPIEFSTDPIPLKYIYVLDQGDRPEIEHLQSREALFSLMPHWYGFNSGVDLLRSLGLSNHFLQCAHLVNKVAICRLRRPRFLSALPDVACLVEEHLAAEIHL